VSAQSVSQAHFSGSKAGCDEVTWRLKVSELIANPLVSVVIPCRNGEPWLAEAIDSCLGQSWRHLEIIVVDDASTDGSREVAARYRDRGVIALESPRRGAAAARNTGLARARGEFIQFLDADDLLDPQKVRVQIERLADAPAGAAASGAWARFRNHTSEAAFTAEPVWRDFSAPEEFLIASWLGGGMMANFAWLSPRAVLDRAGPWDETLSLLDDGEYFCRVVLAASSVMFCRNARGFYRSGAAAGLSRRRDRAALVSGFAAIDLSCRHLLQRCNSPSANSACATNYLRFAYDAYPDARDLVVLAERRARELGGSELRPGGGRAFQFLARGFGWKFGKQCQRAWRYLKAPRAGALP
jgi:glycosyltransferase involved in cell wall biosynthesis